jgi:hypothetical protein
MLCVWREGCWRSCPACGASTHLVVWVQTHIVHFQKRKQLEPAVCQGCCCCFWSIAVAAVAHINPAPECMLLCLSSATCCDSCHAIDGKSSPTCTHKSHTQPGTCSAPHHSNVYPAAPLLSRHTPHALPHSVHSTKHVRVTYFTSLHPRPTP